MIGVGTRIDDVANRLSRKAPDDRNDLIHPIGGTGIHHDGTVDAYLDCDIGASARNHEDVRADRKNFQVASRDAFRRLLGQHHRGSSDETKSAQSDRSP